MKKEEKIAPHTWPTTLSLSWAAPQHYAFLAEGIDFSLCNLALVPAHT